MVKVTSTLEAVVAYQQGAVCTRLAKVALPAGAAPGEVRIVGLPLSLEPGTLRARITEGDPALRVVDVRPSFDVELADEVDVPEEVKALEAAQEEEARLATAEAQAEAEIEALSQLEPRFPEPKRGEPPRPASVPSILSLSAFISDTLADRQDKRRALGAQLDDARREVSLRQARLEEASTTRRTERARLSRAAVVRLSAPLDGPVTLALEYTTLGVRWAPTYELKLGQGAAGGTLGLRAQIAQATGEDWVGVALSLSTAALQRRTDAPELKALKIGRTQPEPPRPGFREPPPGLDELFGPYDAVIASRATTTGGAPPAQQQRRTAPPKGGAVGAKKRKMAPGAPPSVAPMRSGMAFSANDMPMPMAAAMPASVSSERRREKEEAPRAKSALMSRSVSAFRDDSDDEAPMLEEASASLDSEEMAVGGSADDYGGGGVPEPEPEAPGLDARLMDYDALVIPALSAGGQRGRLAPATAAQLAMLAHVSVNVDVVLMVAMQAQSKSRAVLTLPLPAGCTNVGPLNAFDYRYDCAARADVASTGRWISIPVMTCDLGLSPEFVCVPAVEAKVYRTVVLRNTSARALLSGPVDVSQGDAFLMTTHLPPVPPGATDVRLGLGVEESIKVSRKTQYREGSGGFLGGSTVLPHEIDIELNNRLAAPALVEVRERLPLATAGEKDLKVEEGEISPAWEAVTGPLDGRIVKGTRRWRVTVPAGQRTSLKAQFTIRLPADRMLVGGNRRA